MGNASPPSPSHTCFVHKVHLGSRGGGWGRDCAWVPGALGAVGCSLDQFVGRDLSWAVRHPGCVRQPGRMSLSHLWQPSHFSHRKLGTCSPLLRIARGGRGVGRGVQLIDLVLSATPRHPAWWMREPPQKGAAVLALGACRHRT